MVRKNGNRTRRRTVARRPRRRVRRSAPMGRLMPGFPSTQSCIMRYVVAVNIDPGIAAVGNHVFRANSIFDPDLTATGHQPLGHDEWAMFYNHYTVQSSKIKVEYVHNDVVAIGGAFIGLYLSDDATIPSSGLKIAEQGLGKYQTVTEDRAPTRSPKLSNYFSAKKFFNISDIKDNHQLGAAFGANPTEEAFYNVWIAPLDGLSDVGQYTCLVTIDYTVIMHEPKSLTTS